MSEPSIEEMPADGANAPATGGRLGSLIRLAVAAFGLGGLVLGAIVAWRSESATTLLIVSAIMLVLAALGLDWDEIRGEYAGATFQFLRRGWQNVGQEIERVAANEEIPPGVRGELDALREQVRALTPPERVRRPSPSPTSSADMDALFKDLFTTKAMHTFRGSDAVHLSLRTVLKADSFRCTVKTPTGTEYSATTRRPISGTVVGVATYSVTYPDEFDGSEPLGPGRYDVEWRTVTFVDPASGNALARALAPPSHPVATHSFTISDSRIA